jgi:hypothetical protein
VSAGDSEATEAIRDLVETVIVFRDPASPGGVAVEIAGRLNALIGEEAYPNRVKGVWGKVVAGGDSRVPPSSVRTVHRHPEGKKSRLRPFSLAPILRQMAREKQARTRDLRRDGPKDLLRVLLGSPRQKFLSKLKWVVALLVTDAKSVSHWMFCGCSVSENQHPKMRT